jgi:serine/threonine protein kinase
VSLFCGSLTAAIAITDIVGVSLDFIRYGVLLYELLVGKSPFYQRGSSQIDMFKRIVKVEYTCPDFVAPSAADLVKRLLYVPARAAREREHR